MTTNEIAAEVQAGEIGYLPLWEAVQRFVYGRAYRWMVLNNPGGVTADDLQQCAFLALVETVENWDPLRGGFLTLYNLKLGTVFLEAAGLRSKRDPLRGALSLDAPLTDDENLTLADILEDPAAEAEIDNVAEQDFRQRRRKALQAALSTLPEAQRAAVVGWCCYDQKVDKQAYSAGIRALRCPAVSQGLREFL